MQSPRGVEQVGPRPGRVERADQLLGDVGRLADPGHADAAVRLHAGRQAVRGARERLVEPVGHVAEDVRLVPEQVAGPVERGHLVHLSRYGRSHAPRPCGPVRNGGSGYPVILVPAPERQGQPALRLPGPCPTRWPGYPGYAGPRATPDPRSPRMSPARLLIAATILVGLPSPSRAGRPAHVQRARGRQRPRGDRQRPRGGRVGGPEQGRGPRPGATCRMGTSSSRPGRPRWSK